MTTLIGQPHQAQRGSPAPHRPRPFHRRSQSAAPGAMPWCCARRMRMRAFARSIAAKRRAAGRARDPHRRATTTPTGSKPCSTGRAAPIISRSPSRPSARKRCRSARRPASRRSPRARCASSARRSPMSIAETLEQRAMPRNRSTSITRCCRPRSISRAALAPDAPLLWDERGGNLLVESQNGDRAATEAAFARAHKIIRLNSHNQRVSGAPMEPRCTIAEYDKASGSYTIHSVSQGVHRIKFTVAACLGVPMDKVRVITGDVGGGFGVRSSVYPEYAALAWAARKVGRPVKWNSSRAEAFLADYQARDVEVEGALALDKDGKFLALQLSYTGNLGAYPVSYAVLNNVTRMARDRLRHPGDSCARQRRRDQHRADVGLSRRRPAGIEFHPGAHDRSRRRRARHRARRAAPAQHHPGRRAALSIAARPSLRLRRLRREYGKRADARRLGRLSGAARGSRGEGPAARHRRRELSRIADRLRRRAQRHPRSRRRPRRCGDRHAGLGPGP